MFYCFLINSLKNNIYQNNYNINNINKINNIRYLSNKINKNNIINKISLKFSKINIQNSENIYLDNFLKNKKIISISPAGYKGIYCTGICTYIKQNYNLDNYIFSGASAGSWNALLMCYKKDVSVFKNDILLYSLDNTESIIDFELLMKKRILEKFDKNDFELNRLFIGVTTVNRFIPSATIYSNFTTLEDALNCCIASSHIPLVTGRIINKYNNVYSFDGGFCKYPYLNSTKSVLHISPNMWELTKYNDKNINNIYGDNQIFHTTLFSKHKYNFNEMYESGYNDTYRNIKILDLLLI
jgi:hypothetical protein